MALASRGGGRPCVVAKACAHTTLFRQCSSIFWGNSDLPVVPMRRTAKNMAQDHCTSNALCKRGSFNFKDRTLSAMPSSLEVPLLRRWSRRYVLQDLAPSAQAEGGKAQVQRMFAEGSAQPLHDVLCHTRISAIACKASVFEARPQSRRASAPTCASTPSKHCSIAVRITALGISSRLPPTLEAPLAPSRRAVPPKPSLPPFGSNKI